MVLEPEKKKKKSRRIVKTAMTSATHREESNASPGTSQYKFQQQIQAV